MECGMNDPLEYFGSLAIQVPTVLEIYNFGPCVKFLLNQTDPCYYFKPKNKH